MKLIIALYRAFVCYFFMLLLGIVVSILRLISFNKLIRFNSEFLSPFICRVILLMIGIKVKIIAPTISPKDQVIYMFNHNSYLDIFIIPTLGLRNTRFIISERTKKILPLFLCNFGNGAIFIPFKDKPEAREQFFNDLTRRLKKENISIICSPEGVHRFRHGIAKFNQGVFQVASATGLPICSLFFAIPENSNPLETYHFEGGSVKIEILGCSKIDPSRALEDEINYIRELFLKKFNQEFGVTLA